MMSCLDIITGELATRKVYINGFPLSPRPSQKIINHSPDGFNWGYRGSGPAQLALALLLHFCQEDRDKATYLYQKFKSDIISRLPQSNFVLPTAIVENWLAKQELTHEH